MKITIVSVLSSLVVVLAVSSHPLLGAPASTVSKSNAEVFNLTELRKLIVANNDRFTRAHVTGDQTTIDEMFTIDAKCLPPGADPVIGREAISKLTKEYLETGVSEFREVTTDFYGNENLLIDQGTYVMVYGKEKTRETGKYLNVWKKEARVWKIYSNMWNANAPTQPTK